MDINVYLHLNGNCEEAFGFYEKSLGGKIAAVHKFAGSPMEQQVPEEWRGKVMHMTLVADGAILMGSDVPPGRYQIQQGFAVSISLKDPQQAERIFAGLSEGAKIDMPLQSTFWSVRFGMLTDRYGVSWMVNCEAAQ